jgi:very-short-patch-repair endonuclease
VSSDALRWAVRVRVLRRLRHGAYTLEESWERAGSTARHLLQLSAQQRVNPALVACGESAALVWDLPLPTCPSEVRLIARERDSYRGAGRRRSGAAVRRARLVDAEVRRPPGGLLATSPLRTVRDCIRVLPRPWGLALADAAVARRLVRPDELASVVRATPRAPGHRAAAWVADHVRDRVESPLESLARARLVLAGLPEPTPQVWIRTAAGRFRVDLLDERNGVITEADGRVKYGSAEVLWQEKRREDALRDAGFEVVRFTMRDHADPGPWLAGYRRALARARRTSTRPPKSG